MIFGTRPAISTRLNLPFLVNDFGIQEGHQHAEYSPRGLPAPGGTVWDETSDHRAAKQNYTPRANVPHPALTEDVRRHQSWSLQRLEVSQDQAALGLFLDGSPETLRSRRPLSISLNPHYETSRVWSRRRHASGQRILQPPVYEAPTLRLA